MRVLVLSKACYVAVYRKKLEELASLPGVQLTLLVPPYWRTGKSKAVLEPGMSHGYRILVDNPVLNGNFHLHFYPRLPQHLASLKPDLLHVEEEPYDLVTYHALRCARRAGIRTVFFTWQNIARRFPLPFRWFERYTLAHSAGAIAGNQAAGEILRRKGYRGPLALIPQFGVDPQLYSPRQGLQYLDGMADTTAGGREVNAPFLGGNEVALPLGSDDLREAAGARTDRGQRDSSHVVHEDQNSVAIASGKARPLRIAYVGRFVPEKGIMVLLDAVAGLQGSWCLVLLGDGPLRPVIEKRCQARDLDGKVELRTSIPSASVPGFLREVDILVLPSLTTRGWMEQFGRVLVEAMACGVAVVGSDSGEIPNVIGGAGLIAKEGDAADLRRQIQALLVDPALRQRLGEIGRNRVMNHYTQRQIAIETFQFYHQVLEQPGVV